MFAIHFLVRMLLGNPLRGLQARPGPFGGKFFSLHTLVLDFRGWLGQAIGMATFSWEAE